MPLEENIAYKKYLRKRKRREEERRNVKRTKSPRGRKTRGRPRRIVRVDSYGNRIVRRTQPWGQESSEDIFSLNEAADIFYAKEAEKSIPKARAKERVERKRKHLRLKKQQGCVLGLKLSPVYE